MGRTVSQRGQALPTPDAGALREPDRSAPEGEVVAMLCGRGDPVGDREPESRVAAWIALRRAHQGGVANLAGHWLDSGRRVPGDLAVVFDELTNTGLLALTEPDSEELRQVTLTTAGHTRYEQLHGTPRPTGLPVIDSPEAAGQALGDFFLANADRGDDAANDHLVAELVRRIRAQRDSRDGGRGQRPPSRPAGCTPAGVDCRG